MECIHLASASVGATHLIVFKVWKAAICPDCIARDWLIIVELYVTLDLVRHVLMARVQLVSSISDCKSRVVPNLWMRLNIFTDGQFDKDIAMTYLGAPLALAMSIIVSCSDCCTVSVMQCAITVAQFWMIFYGIVSVMVIPRW